MSSEDGSKKGRQGLGEPSQDPAHGWSPGRPRASHQFSETLLFPLLPSFGNDNLFSSPDPLQGLLQVSPSSPQSFQAHITSPGNLILRAMLASGRIRWCFPVCPQSPLGLSASLQEEPNWIRELRALHPCGGSQLTFNPLSSGE